MDNVFLLLVRLDWGSANPFVGSGRMRDDDQQKYSMLIGVLDQTRKGTGTALANISFGRARRRMYNHVLQQVEEIFQSFERSGGYIDERTTFGVAERLRVVRTIEFVGQEIFAFLEFAQVGDIGAKAVRQALEDLLAQAATPTRPPTELPVGQAGDRGGGERTRAVGRPHVTIVTNDFSIPWFWMRLPGAEHALCETHPLGMMQLSGPGTTPLRASTATRRAEGNRRAMFVEGTSDLAFLKDELAVFKAAIEGVDERERKHRGFEVEEVMEPRQIRANERGRSDRKHLYRILHYSGHWTLADDGLQLKQGPVDVIDLEDYIEDAVLTLDGCSTARGLEAWNEVDNLTGKLLGAGARGCIVSMLPVRNDPVMASVLWSSFYNAIVGTSGAVTLGQALLDARVRVRDAFKGTDLDGVTALSYQLIGNPTAYLSTPRA